MHDVAFWIGVSIWAEIILAAALALVLGIWLVWSVVRLVQWWRRRRRG